MALRGAFRVAIFDEFFDAFARIPRAQQKKVNRFVRKFRDDPTHVGRPWSPGELNEFLGARAFDVIRSGRARSPALWPASGPLLAFGVVGRDARAAHRALEQIAGLASYAVARPA